MHASAIVPRPLINKTWSRSKAWEATPLPRHLAVTSVRAGGADVEVAICGRVEGCKMATPSFSGTHVRASVPACDDDVHGIDVIPVGGHHRADILTTTPKQGLRNTRKPDDVS